MTGSHIAYITSFKKVKWTLDEKTVSKYKVTSPSMELTLSRWRGLSTKQFQPECVNEESSTERRSKRCQVNRSFQPYQDLSQRWLGKIKKDFSS